MCVCVLTELYEYCIKEGYADKNLIAKWKKQGYENLCCLRCIQTRDTNFGTNCICRVPKSKLEVVSFLMKIVLQKKKKQSLFLPFRLSLSVCSTLFPLMSTDSSDWKAAGSSSRKITKRNKINKPLMAPQTVCGSDWVSEAAAVTSHSVH